MFKSLGSPSRTSPPPSSSCGRRASRRRRRGGLLIPFAEIERAQETIAGAAIRTPLVRLQVDALAEIWLKLENLQPIGSFKIRGAVNAIRQALLVDVRDGVVTASAGNMAQRRRLGGAELGVAATVVVPEQAPQTKLDAIERPGARVVKVPHERWWQTLVDGRTDEADGFFVHPVQDERVMAGNGTIGRSWPTSRTPTASSWWGGGGLFTGSPAPSPRCGPRPASTRPEPETAAAVTAAWRQVSRARPTTRRPS